MNDIIRPGQARSKFEGVSPLERWAEEDRDEERDKLSAAYEIERQREMEYK